MTLLAPSPRLAVALARIRVLRARVEQVQQRLNVGQQVPRELDLDDREMLELERDILDLVREHQEAAAAIGNYRSFWRATYEQWIPADGAKRFWGLLGHQLGETEHVLSELSSSTHAPGRALQ